MRWNENGLRSETTKSRSLIENQNPAIQRSSDDGVLAARQRLVSENP